MQADDDDANPASIKWSVCTDSYSSGNRVAAGTEDAEQPKAAIQSEMVPGTARGTGLLWNASDARARTFEGSNRLEGADL